MSRNYNCKDFVTRYNLPDLSKDKFEHRRKMFESVPLAFRIAVDQYSAQDFHQNDFGWPASDIALAFKAETLEQFELAVSRLRELQLNSESNKGKSDEQIISEIMPKWIQTAGERNKYIQYTHSLLVPVGQESVSQELESSVEESTTT